MSNLGPDEIALDIVIQYDLTANEARALRDVLRASFDAAGEPSFWAFLDEMPTDETWTVKKRGGALASLSRKGIIRPVGPDEAAGTGELVTYCYIVDMEGNITPPSN